MVQKQGFNIPFGQGLDLKTDPNQVVAGKMLGLQNATFNKNQLQKRNGYPLLTTLPDASQTTLTTLNGNLVATGTNLLAYSAPSQEWLSKGTVQPVAMEVTPIVRNSLNVTWSDTAAADTGLSCTVYGDSSHAYYQVNDSSGQSIVAQTALPSSTALARVYVLGRNFILLFTRTVAAVPHIQYIAIPINDPSNPGSAVNLVSNALAVTGGFDGYVANNNLYCIYNANDGGRAVRMFYLTSTLAVSSVKILAASIGDICAITADTTGTTAVIWAAFYDTVTDDTYVAAFSQTLVTILGPTLLVNNTEINQLTAIAKNGTTYVYYQVANEYSYAAVETDYIENTNCTQAGVVSSSTVIARGLGLASKAFFNSDSTGYMLACYGQAYQKSYFLIDWAGTVLAKLAYSNGSGYHATTILPNANISENSAKISYLLADLLTSVNKSQGVANTAGIYAQVGVNLVSFDINSNQQQSSDIAASLHLTGGILWQYDGVKPVEHSFHVWPEDLYVTTNAAGGFLTDQTYFYKATYEWTDANGNLHRSAPSVPITKVTVGGNTSTNTINVPTLRITKKITPNPVRIVLYRWSTAQQDYYQVTSITSPTLNNPAVDSVAITDTLADSSILGNTLLYTTGNVLENIAAPACTDSTLLKSRVWLIDAEDENLLWYSKPVLSGTPVEFTDFQTIYLAPTAGAQGPTGNTKCLSAMDDKLIMFKKDAIYYLTGNGPDVTGANNDFSDPVFITGTVGCENPNSIVFCPLGIMFQSDKGIWLLGRDLSTKYIGDAVETFNASSIISAISVPETNEVRFNLDDGTVLLYDYYYNQWATNVNVPGISSTLYQGKHTYLNAQGEIKQQGDEYLDGARPVLLSFTTAWLKLSDLQGFQRAYWFNFLGKYVSPHKLNIQIAYDFDPSIKQTVVITPDNFSNRYGEDALYGSSSINGGPSPIEQWRIFFNQQKCQAIQITVTEVYDPSFGVVSGAGFTMSGINLVVGAKSTYPKLNSSRSAG